LYLTSIERRKNRTNPTGPINAWKSILNTLTIHYGDRLAAVNQRHRPPRSHTRRSSPRLRGHLLVHAHSPKVGRLRASASRIEAHVLLAMAEYIT
ncbi:MAG: hypothetical protein GY788_06570, partial [bacterium]|nr:hypothetical protein [bacterium]